MSDADGGSRPEFHDFLYRKRNKNGNFKVLEPPHLKYPIADSHAHLGMLGDPSFALARAAYRGVTFIETMTDPAEYSTQTFDMLDSWLEGCSSYLEDLVDNPENPGLACDFGELGVPRVRIGVGVHPHSSSKYDEGMLKDLIGDARVSALGEIGLDYHYDYSPREVQRDVFERQVQLARNVGLPVILHVRDAFDDAYAIMCDVGWPDAGCLLHCYTATPDEIGRWIDAGCHIAFGGAATFGRNEAIRASIPLVPMDRLLLETDSPYLSPQPLRGSICLPDYIIWTADFLMRQVFCAEGRQETEQLCRIYQNTIDLLDRPRSVHEGTDTRVS